MEAEQFRGWLEFMGLNDAEAKAVLGLGSRNTVAKFKLQGAPRYIGLACAALATGLSPWVYQTNEGTSEMSEEDQLIEQAVRQQGSRSFNTPSGATMEQLSEFIKAGRFSAFSKLYKRFQQVHPGNAAYMESQIMAKVRTALVLRNGSVKALQDLESGIPDFATDTFKALQSPGTFDTYMRTIESRL